MKSNPKNPPYLRGITSKRPSQEEKHKFLKIQLQKKVYKIKRNKRKNRPKFGVISVLLKKEGIPATTANPCLAHKPVLTPFGDI